jgi:hypothetical protein
MRIEILYFEGCPNHRPTVELVRQSVDESGLAAQLEEVEVRDDADARRLRFLGSPTVRVDGVDVEPDVGARRDYAIGCRVYGETGIPPRNLVVAALRRGPAVAAPPGAPHGS